MADSQYQTKSYKLGSKGVIARYVNDDMPPGSYQNLLSLESRAENALATRLGLAALSTDGNNNFPMGGPVYTVGRMKGLDTGFRYAAAAHQLWRKSGDTAGPFESIASNLSGKNISLAPYRPNANANPYMFIADDSVFLKDNGSTPAFNWGIKPPTIPPFLQIGDPEKTVIENFDESAVTSFTLSNVSAIRDDKYRFFFTTPQAINIGLNTVTVPTLSILQFQRTGGVATIFMPPVLSGFRPLIGMKIALTNMPDSSFNTSGAIVLSNNLLISFTITSPGPDVPLTAGGGGLISALPSLQPGMLIDVQDVSGTTVEIIYLITVTTTGFTANFSLNHPVNAITGTTILFSQTLTGTVAANTTASVTKKEVINLGLVGLVASQPTDFIQFELLTSNPQAIQEIKMLFDVGDGTFTQDYYWKSIVPSTYQAAVSGTRVTTDVQTSRIADRASSVADARTLGVQVTDLVPTDLQDLPQLRPVEINTGLNSWTAVQAMLQEFVPVGLAGGVNNNWANVVAWQIQIITSPNIAANFSLSSLALIGGSGLDSFNGEPYDYRYTYYNLATGCESNGSITLQSNFFISPRRQPIAVTLTPSPDPQVTHWRLYRRGGTLTQAWYMVDQIPVTTTMPYEDVVDDATIELNEQLIVDADAPIVSVMRQPVNEMIQSITTGQLWEPNTLFTVGQIAIDSNGDQELLEGVRLGTRLKTVHIFDGGLLIQVDVPFTPAQAASLPGKRIKFINVGTSTFLDNFVCIIAATTVPTGILVLNLPPSFPTDYGPVNDTGQVYVLSGSGFSGPTAPPWPPPPQEISEPALLWRNLGPPPALFAGGTIATVQLPDISSVFPGQLVTVGSGATQEQAYVSFIDAAQSSVVLFLQSPHLPGEIFAANTRPLPGLNLMAIAFDQAFLAGDPDNPHVLYYSNTFQPETFPQENFIEVGTPDSPIMALVVLRGLLYVFTTKTVYQIYGGGGATPIPVPTGCMHGLVASFAWAASENVIYYMSYDGVYAFQGSGSQYMTLDTEWVWTGKNLGPVPAIDTTQKANIFMAYANHELFVSYLDQTGARRRMIWSDTYIRWRPDMTVPEITSEFFEQDTGQLVVGGADGMVYLDRINDYDSGGFAGGVEIVNEIAFQLQTAQMDLESPKAFKNFNELTIDANLNGNTVNVFLVFDNGATVVSAGTISGTGRSQYQININNGQGTRSLNVGLLLTGSTKSVIYLNEIHIRAVVEAEFRRSFDSYWLRQGVENWKVWKQGWLEYAAVDPNGIQFKVYTEGNMTTPLYSFTVPQSLTRVTKRVRFPAHKAKLWRIVGTSASDFQFYAPESLIESKVQSAGSGYAKAPLPS